MHGFSANPGMIGPALDDGVNSLVRMTHVCAGV